MGHMGHAAAHAAPVALGVTSRAPHASPLFRLVQDHSRACKPSTTSVSPRPMARGGRSREVADKFLACGILEHGFARVRCDAARHETCSPSPASAATSVRAVTPSA